jgi:hypothetical protein
MEMRYCGRGLPRKPVAEGWYLVHNYLLVEALGFKDGGRRECCPFFFALPFWREATAPEVEAGLSPCCTSGMS